MTQDTRHQQGRWGDRLARQFLMAYGFVIEQTNVRYPVGEVDIVAQEGNTLCFVEVRSKTSERFGSAAESITWKKRQHLLRAAQWYLARRRVRWTGEVRFDVLAIDCHEDGKPDIELVRGAWTSDP
jgi:putative endonuclease